ncbi:unnamed protein product [Mycena citricolor]|uniref:GAF domain-containing protein n=1 Tax=Mycena citricolor TaxID=2018698 RepID=A0AAD2HSW4_9AGAR|nr:unnamed protein product [Mycena citricolor]
MPHADSALVPETVTTKAEFWAHVLEQLQFLLDPEQRNWVTNMSNASSLIYNSLLAFPAHFGADARQVNWCGFYLDSRLFPNARGPGHAAAGASDACERLLLGPFNGKPACQYIATVPGKARGVCADAYLQGRTVVVRDVEAYPGHIACDGETRSEIVCPLVLREGDSTRVLGVLDLDCLAEGGFGDEDKVRIKSHVRAPFGTC